MSGIGYARACVADAVSLEDLKRDNAEIAKGVRLSGSPAEAEAFAYIADRCRSFGMEVHEYAVDAYVSLPGAASLAVVSPESARYRLHHPFLLRRDGAGRARPGHSSTSARGRRRPTTRARTCAARSCSTDGLASPGAALAADRAGAVGMICVNPAGLHEMIISPVWGTPTPETAPYLPKVAAVSIRKEEGDDAQGAPGTRAGHRASADGRSRPDGGRSPRSPPTFPARSKIAMSCSVGMWIRGTTGRWTMRAPTRRCSKSAASSASTRANCGAGCGSPSGPATRMRDTVHRRGTRTTSSRTCTSTASATSMRNPPAGEGHRTSRRRATWPKRGRSRPVSCAISSGSR